MTDHSQLVKHLEWRRGYCSEAVTIEQISFGGMWQARQYDGQVWVDLPNGRSVIAGSLEDAKAAAQADYTARIISALNLDAIDALQARVTELEAGLRRIVDAPMIDHRNPANGAQHIARALLERNPS